ncbi:hypothetical protein Leryth_012566 [Lithospermum erythrorhizon]|nr:hypothetical protein Leryth_012566 [Lithospermum erythrorhizon]
MDAEFDDNSQVWRTLSVGKDKKGEFVETEYVSKYLVVATGENAEEVTPSFEGMDEFGQLFHSSQYRNGYMFKDKKVLVVGTGNSGMEIALDLANYDAKPTLAIRDASHIWPREMLGMSTFKVAVFLQKLFPIRVVDFLMFLLTYLFLGDISKLGIHRPRVGPLELKMRTGKTPVLDVGTLAKVREGKIKVIRGGIAKLADHAVEFMDGTIENFDAIVLATGFRSNVPTWLKGIEFFSERTGYPLQQFSKDCWKGPDGLYTVGFSKRGLFGVYMDALKVADDIAGIS